MDYHRRSIRLKGFDYSSDGLYFVTVDLEDKRNWLWEVDNKGGDEIGEKGGHVGPPVHMNEIGKMMDYWWGEIKNHFRSVRLGEYVIMPNHIHGIIIIKNSVVSPVGADRCVRPMSDRCVRPMSDRCVRPMLGNIIQWFKTMTTNEYINNVKSDNWPRFVKRLWQRNYYERIIRNEKEYEAIKKYIRENPINWNTNQKMDLLK